MVNFQSDCGIPPDGVTFVSSSYIRGTLDIVWSCASILILCTWSILHLNVPPQSSPGPGRHMQKLRRDIARLGTKALWMLINIIAPEFAFAKAWSDRIAAKRVTTRVEGYAKRDGVPWGVSHTYFANMGGFAIKFSPQQDEPAQDSTPDDANATVISASNPPDSNSPLARAVTLPEKLVSKTTLKWSSSAVRTCSSGITAVPSTHELQNVHIDPASVEAEKREISGGHALPDPVRLRLERYSKMKVFSKEMLLKRMERASSLYGEIDWRIDESNSALVAQAVELVTHKQFPWQSDRMEFLFYWRSWLSNLRVFQGDVWILDAQQLLVARELGIIDRLPLVSDEDLDDRNKGDALVKIAAVAQITWFIIQLISRLCSGLATSQLEVTTFATALCSVLTYLVLLDKPQNVSYSVIIPAGRRAKSPEELVQLALLGPSPIFYMRKSMWIPNDALHFDSTQEDRPGSHDRNLRRGTAFAVLIFGAAHCIAWNFVFATEIERTLWIVSSVVIGVAIPAILVVTSGYVWILGLLGYQDDRTIGGNEILAVNTMIWILGLGFLTARGFILVEVFRSLAFMLPSGYLTSWPANLPHIS